MAEQDFIKAGFTVLGTENNENKLLIFLKENYPSVIKDNEIDLQELKAIAGLPIDEKVNGYGLNFVGRNFARAKYAQKTEKELRLNTELSKNIDTTENLVLKGDNLDSLKILKNHYSGQIKCIYIDPPYNTTSDEFVYPDKFNKEEAEVLGFVDLSESDFTRMDFSFKTKKSHNGWLAFMYPRLLIARDLLKKDGVIFISIDDNEQANLKLLCDDIFGEENMLANIIWKKRSSPDARTIIGCIHDYILCYVKDIEYSRIAISKTGLSLDRKSAFQNPDNDPRGLWSSVDMTGMTARAPKSQYYKITLPSGRTIDPPEGRAWGLAEKTFIEMLSDNRIWFGKNGDGIPRMKRFLSESEGQVVPSLWDIKEVGSNDEAKKELNVLLGQPEVFDTPKPLRAMQRIVQIGSDKNEIILDFFAGSGALGNAVMQQNAEDGGNRKFILCQIDEPIKADKPAYKFCVENNLPPVISSITIERLKRAGEKIKNDIEEKNSKAGLFEEDKKQVPDIGFKVFDSVEAPKLKVDDKGQISITENETDALSRIYNMIFTVGLDEPTQVPEEVVKDCIYKIGNHYYITNSDKITSDDYSDAIKNAHPGGGKVFIDGWTASLNGTLQNYKEDVKIVF